MKSNSNAIKLMLQLLQGAYSSGTNMPDVQCSRIFQLLNNERAKAGLNSLVYNTALNGLAFMKCREMVEKSYFSHQSPTYGSPFDMIRSNGISYICAGENLAIDSNADYAHTAWMNSPEHRKNILHRSFTQVGIGVHPKGNGSYTYAQLFIG